MHIIINMIFGFYIMKLHKKSKIIFNLSASTKQERPLARYFFSMTFYGFIYLLLLIAMLARSL